MLPLQRRLRLEPPLVRRSTGPCTTPARPAFPAPSGWPRGPTSTPSRTCRPRSARRSLRVCGRVERAVLTLGRRGSRPRLPLGRRWRALPRLVRAAAARPARHERPPADGVGGRACPRRPTTRSPRPGAASRPRCTAMTRRDRVPRVARAPARARRRGLHRARVDDRRGRVRGVRPGGARGRHRAARRPGGRRRGRLLQRDGVGAARRGVPPRRRHLPLRPRGARRLVGLPRRLGVHGRQDGVAAPRWR